MMPTEQDLAFLFERDESQLRPFLHNHKNVFERYGMTESDFKELAAEPLDQQVIQAFSIVFAKTIDWREYDEEIVRLLGESIPEDVEVVNTDEGLEVTYDGNVYTIKLSFSPQDRYITIRGFAAIIKDKYEPRLITESYMSDTHEILVLPNEVWQRMQQQYPAQVESIFMIIHDSLDFP